MSKKKTEHILFDRDRIPKIKIPFIKVNRSNKMQRRIEMRRKKYTSKEK